MSPRSKSDGQPSLRSRRRDATRLEILASTRAIFGERGYTEVHMDAVASRAGVSVGTLYNYFADRASLLHALMVKQQDEFLAALDANLQSCASKPFDAALLGFVRCLLDYAEADRSLICAITEGGSNNEPKTELHQAFRMAVYERTVRLMALCPANRLAPGHAALFPSLLLGAVRGAIQYHLRCNLPGLGQTAEPLVAIMLRGLLRD